MSDADDTHVATTSQKAPPKSVKRLVWRAILLLLVGIPVLLAALVGLPHLFRNAQLRNVLAMETGGAPLLAVASAHFPSTIALLTDAR